MRSTMNGLPICASCHTSWEDLAACDVLANVTATLDATRDLLDVLDDIQTPLRRVSVHFGHVSDNPIVLPRYRRSRNNRNGSLMRLSTLDSLRVCQPEAHPIICRPSDHHLRQLCASCITTKTPRSSI